MADDEMRTRGKLGRTLAWMALVAGAAVLLAWLGWRFGYWLGSS